MRAAGYLLLGVLTVTMLLSDVWAEEKFDVVIRNGRIVDGSGAPWYYGDVGIRHGQIIRIGRIEVSTADTAGADASGSGATTDTGKSVQPEIIDAAGLVVAPGFIDMMGQTASPMVADPKTAINLLTQGITTINAGEGSSAAPLSVADGARSGWTTMTEYFALLDIQGLPVNVVQTIGHTQVRRIVLGDVERRPDAAELEQMQQLLRRKVKIRGTPSFNSFAQARLHCRKACRRPIRYWRSSRNLFPSAPMSVPRQVINQPLIHVLSGRFRDCWQDMSATSA